MLRYSTTDSQRTSTDTTKTGDESGLTKKNVIKLNRSNQLIEGARVILSFIVMMHHIDNINPDILNNNIAWKQRRMAVNIWNVKHANISALGMFIYVING